MEIFIILVYITVGKSIVNIYDYRCRGKYTTKVVYWGYRPTYHTTYGSMVGVQQTSLLLENAS